METYMIDTIGTDGFEVSFPVIDFHTWISSQWKNSTFIFSTQKNNPSVVYELCPCRFEVSESGLNTLGIIIGYLYSEVI
jgi:hypothetical protein